jgi:hypothetical protein
MLSFQDLKTRFQKITSDESTSNGTFGAQLINETHKLICGSKPWTFTERIVNTLSTTGQATIPLPVDYRKLITWYFTVGDQKYTPREVPNEQKWDIITARTSVTSDFPTFFHIRNGRIEVYPALSSAGKVITTISQVIPKDMSQDNYTTGQISGLDNGNNVVTGIGTSWPGDNQLIGRYLRIDQDGFWYEIKDVNSTTELTLVKNYEGVSVIALNPKDYTIIERPIVPEEFQDLLWLRPVSIYFMMKGDEQRARFYETEYQRLLRLMTKKYQSKTTINVIQDLDIRQVVRGPNNPPIDITD